MSGRLQKHGLLLPQFGHFGVSVNLTGVMSILNNNSFLENFLISRCFVIRCFFKMLECPAYSLAQFAVLNRFIFQQTTHILLVVLNTRNILVHLWYRYSDNRQLSCIRRLAYIESLRHFLCVFCDLSHA